MNIGSKYWLSVSLICNNRICIGPERAMSVDPYLLHCLSITICQESILALDRPNWCGSSTDSWLNQALAEVDREISENIFPSRKAFRHVLQLFFQ